MFLVIKCAIYMISTETDDVYFLRSYSIRPAIHLI